MPDIYMADISEFQTNIDAPSYLTAYQCVIVRTHNGNRPDRLMPGRMNYLRGFPFVAVGWYQYLVAGRDPIAQAHDFIATIDGGLRPNEFPVLDVEEGGGDQTGRVQAWFSVVDAWAGFPAMLYSGDSFLTHQIGGAARWPGRPIWVAAYGTNNGQPQREPAQPHTLWQFSSTWQCTGMTPPACDGSVHHNTAQEFIVSVRAGIAGPVPPPDPTPAPPPPPARVAPTFPYPPSHYLAKPSPDPHCHSGHYGGVDATHVRAWQQQMAARGWRITADGDFGNQSDAVCRGFQADCTAQGWPLAQDGKVGPDTWRASWARPVS